MKNTTYLLIGLLSVLSQAKCESLLIGDVQKEVIKKDLEEIESLKQAQLHPGSLRSVELLAANYFKASISTGLRSGVTETRPKWYMAHSRMEQTIKDESYVDYVLGFGLVGPLVKFLTKDDPDFTYLEKETKSRGSAPVASGFFNRYFDPKTGRDKKDDTSSFNRVDQETRARVDSLFDRYLIYPCKGYTDLMVQQKGESALKKYDSEIEKWNEYNGDDDDSKKQLVHDFLFNRAALIICKHITEHRDEYRKCVSSTC